MNPYGCNNDLTYNRLIRAVKDYCKEYRTAVFKTTVEGGVICENSLRIVYEWLEEYWGEKQFEKYRKDVNKYSEKIQVSIMRGIFHGKTDYLLEYTNKKDRKEKHDSDMLKIINKYKSGKKTDGWVVKFFDWYDMTYNTNDMEKIVKTLRLHSQN